MRIRAIADEAVATVERYEASNKDVVVLNNLNLESTIYFRTVLSFVKCDPRTGLQDSRRLSDKHSEIPRPIAAPPGSDIK